MQLKHLEEPRSGEVTGKSVGIYFLLWLLGVPGIILIILFMVGVGR
jgi:hypothetical protein